MSEERAFLRTRQRQIDRAYVCPSCKGPLEGANCLRCLARYEVSDGIRDFFTSSAMAERYRRIAAFYDDLYRDDQDVWERLAGRGQEFRRYMAGLVGGSGPRRYLDLGCGGGFLLEAVSAEEKFGVEISSEAARVAGFRSGAGVCLGIAEELPFPAGYLDVVTGVGVTEHLLDDVAGTREVHRVLRAKGHYIVLLYMATPWSERVAIKVEEFFCPSFRGVALSKWLLAKCAAVKEARLEKRGRPVTMVQPVQNRYTPRSVKSLFTSCGFTVKRVITKRRMPDAPLAGHDSRIYILEKA